MIKAQELSAIQLRGVRQNNLKNIDLDIPLKKMTVITGVSGSGKSSLAFDVLYAEGQRRYVETFSSYTRQFLDRMSKPEAESLEGIPPAVAIDQSGAIKNSRSTVGTMTGINDYLKILFSRCASPFCPECHEEVSVHDTASVTRFLSDSTPEQFPALLIADLYLGTFENVDLIRDSVRAQGYSRFLRGPSPVRLDDLTSDDLKEGYLPIIVDRLSSTTRSGRIADSVDQTFRLGRGSLRIVFEDGSERAFHDGLRCGGCGMEFPRPSPGLFSFNSPYGACDTCRGFGKVIDIDFERVIPDPRLSIDEGAIKPWNTPSRRRHLTKLKRFCQEEGIRTDIPFGRLSKVNKQKIIEGHGRYKGIQGFFDRLEQKKYKMHVRVLLSRYRGYFKCGDCEGRRLRKEAFYFRIKGKTLSDLWQDPIFKLKDRVSEWKKLKLDKASQLLIKEVSSRLEYLDAVGLGYLTLDRQSRTLSGGEVQRVNLTTALGASLVETLFILDEPSIGLHSRDNDRLIKILNAIRDRGNTLVVVEHDPDILNAADHIIDLGPGAGSEGGEVVAEGTVDQVCLDSRSLTGAYLSGKKKVTPAQQPPRSFAEGHAIKLQGAYANNLKNIDVEIPLGGVVSVTGVSGSGKSTLVQEVLYRASQRASGQAVEGLIALDSIEGLDLIDEIVLVDQSPLGRTSRGNPATYVKVYNAIRDRFAATEQAQMAGYKARHFSFNVAGGRCEECAGAGAVDVEMQFLSDVSLPCEACDGRRFTEAVLEIEYNGLNIHSTLELTIRDAIEHFDQDPEIVDPLVFLDGLGLGYLKLGQPLNTLSGGEAQRLKLASKVLQTKRQRLLFLLDEPTTGLHLDDVKRLIEVLEGLVNKGHSVVVIEHHLDVILASDHVIDLGPEGGDRGGEIVAQGTPKSLLSQSRSITGQWLTNYVKARKRKLKTSRYQVPNGKGSIRVIGARENNLKNINIDIPRDQFVVVTGMSGSGKSSLLYDIVYAEGQRRYLDCLSPYARQFVEELHRPDLDHLEGIPPTVAIEQRTTIGGRKSTVGTVTEIYQFLRLLYTRVGTQYCPECEVPVVPRSQEQICNEVTRLAKKGGILLAPVVRGKKGFHHTLLNKAARTGIQQARIDGEMVTLDRNQEIRLERQRAHDIDLVVGEFFSTARLKHHVRDSVELGLDFSGGVVLFVDTDGNETILNRYRTCPSCSKAFKEPDPRNFSFNSRHGSCAACDGYGFRTQIDAESLVVSWNDALDTTKNGPLAFLEESPFPKTLKRRFLKELKDEGIDTKASLAKLSASQRKAFFFGNNKTGFKGLEAIVDASLERVEIDERETFLRRFGREETCSACKGSRLKSQWAAVKVDGVGIAELAQGSIESFKSKLKSFRLKGVREEKIGKPILSELIARSSFLIELGLGYLGIGRRVDTLSAGEAQRIRLASQLGSNLRGVCYILDEPTIGLHAVDNLRLIDSLKKLRDRGNSVLVIEHDESTIAASDHVIDLGPGPGRLGGRVVAEGRLDELMASERSVTGRCLRERDSFDVSISDKTPRGPWIEIIQADANNLKKIDAKFPIGNVTVVCGVSGAGKSTLVREVLEKNLRKKLQGQTRTSWKCRRLTGWKDIVSLREVDQRPIGRSPRSTPATYVGIWNSIRKIFSSNPESKTRGYSPARFSFNVKGGRCEQCGGQGQIKMEMNFLPDVRVDCDRCRGERFNPETLQITYNGLNISEVLNLEVSEAREFFSTYQELVRPLEVLQDLGLGYLTLGQASTTLSGGEAQRVKLALELSKKTGGGKALYILDEPTTGLHLADVEQLSAILRRLADQGHAVVVIEHQLDIIARADWVIELGPEGGDRGGQVVYQGPPAGLFDSKLDTPTARCLIQEFPSKPSLV